MLTKTSPENLPNTAEKSVPGVDKRMTVSYQEETVVSRSGPLPDPAVLAGYEAILHGAAERVFAMAEREQAHEHEFRRTVVGYERDYLARGQWFALIAVLAICSVAGVIAWSGAPVAAATLAGAVVVGLAGAFLTGRIGNAKRVPESSDADETTEKPKAKPAKRPAKK